jgi:hypothetical protein
MLVEAPLTGSLIVMLWAPSDDEGAESIIWLPLTDKMGAAWPPTLAMNPGAKPIPLIVIGAPVAAMRVGDTVSA